MSKKQRYGQPTPRVALRIARYSRVPKFTQTKMARLVGIPETRYWEIENGYRAGTPAERKAIARALGVKVDAVFPSEVSA